MLLLACCCSAQTTSPVGQPIPFSHKKHVETAHLKCADCHKLARSGEVFSIPTGPTCMTCHAQIAKDSPAIKDLKEYVAEKQPVPWVRVYEIPSFVNFDHKTHLNAGTKCETCHGPVATRDYLWRETDLSMGGCFNCHRQTGATTNCAACHNLE
ncbi:MAG TPA: cytochrome c3 family protein [Bryobacteraceae bacterium]|nr:cytochrome c3 family protein [Bryobacteraceae bacterium]